MRCSIFRAASLAWVAMFVTLPCAWSGARTLTPRAALETSRFMKSASGAVAVVSPDGQRYVVATVTGDAARDGAWLEVRVGRLDSLRTAQPRRIARLFTHGRGADYLRHGGSELLLSPARNVPRWIDDEHVALLWEDAATHRQVVSIAVDTGTLRYLTSDPHDVDDFAAQAGGRTLLYRAAAPCLQRPTPTEQADGWVVDAQDAYELLYGCGAWRRNDHRLFVIDAQHPSARPVIFEGGDAISRSAALVPMVLSPSGRIGIAATSVSEVPEQWSAYTAEHFRRMWQARLAASAAADPYAAQFQQLFVVRTGDATARALWAVPNEPYGRLRVAWSSDELRVAVGPTFLPVQEAGAAGLAGEAVAVVNIDDARVESVPVPREVARRMRQLRWLGSSKIEVQLDEGCLRYVREDRWREDAAGACSTSANAAAVQVVLREDLNSPPVLVAREVGSGQEQLAWDPNPGLMQRYRMGHVEWLDQVVNGMRWRGRLYYPTDYVPGQRYPLVIQTHSMAGRQEFSLYGRGGGSPALGPGVSAYLAQPLANRGFFVLHGRADAHIEDASPHALQARITATEHVVEHLVREGRVDRNRVGVMGFSASGWNVSYALSHSSFPYAAALTDDNKDGSYSQAMLSGWNVGAGEEMIGAPPFAAGLGDWWAQSPAFNVETIRTPLLLTASSPGTQIGKWELFSRLRYLHKPVELYVVPDIAHGSHALQNPTQLLSLQQRALDWWCFWLKDEVDTDPRKSEQYERWQVLRELRDRQLRARRTYPSAAL